MTLSGMERIWGVTEDESKGILSIPTLVSKFREDLSRGMERLITYAEVLQIAQAEQLVETRMLSPDHDPFFLLWPLASVWAFREFPGKMKQLYTDFGQTVSELAGDVALGPGLSKGREASRKVNAMFSTEGVATPEFTRKALDTMVRVYFE